ncbi:MAG: hypothetical protein AAFO99_04460 [Bacteroidota bacterium]
MKKISLILVAVVLFSSTDLFANDAKKGKSGKSETLSTQIGTLLKDNTFNVDFVNLTAEVTFTLNDKQEIVVLSVETDNGILEEFVKSRLNYEKVDTSEYRKGKTYIVPIRITA